MESMVLPARCEPKKILSNMTKGLKTRERESGEGRESFFACPPETSSLTLHPAHPTRCSDRDSVCALQDIEISSDESTRLPLNFLMVKAMHDRELMMMKTRTKRKSGLHDKSRAGDRLSPRDQRMLRRSAHFARFAAASYDGFLDNIKEIIENEASEALPTDLLSQRCEEERGGEGGAFAAGGRLRQSDT